MYQMFQTETGLDIAIYVPGFTREELNVEKSDDFLVVSGSSKSKYVYEPSIYYKFKLIQQTKVEPELINGVLLLHVDIMKPKTNKLDIH